MKPAINYKKHQTDQQKTRAQVVLELYEHAIANLEVCLECSEPREEDPRYAPAFVKSQAAMMGLQAGLDSENNEVAYNVARLLHYVVARVEAQEFAVALDMLRQLKAAYEAIEEEANQLEDSGDIPGIEPVAEMQVTA